MAVAGIVLAAIFGLGGCQGMKARLQEAENHYEYGLLYLRNGKYNLAFGEFQKARELNPKDPRVYNGLGLTYYFQGKFSAAIQEYHKAIRLSPEYPEAYNNLAAALGKEERWSEVIRYADRALAIPSYTTPELAHFNKGLAYYRRGEYEKARTEFETSLELDANYADTHFHLGLTLLALKQHASAVKSFQKALELLSMAEESQNDALAVECRYHLALAYFQSGQSDLAAREFQKVIDLAPDSGRAGEARGYLGRLKMK
ncbi:MAG: tetratricopeptide repeat protein [bacterium]